MTTATGTPAPTADLPPLPPLVGRPSPRRRVANAAAWGSAFLALALVVAPCVWVVAGVVARAAPHWKWAVLTTPGSAHTPGLPAGGLENAILGTLVFMVGVTIVAGAIGIASGIHLAEHARPRPGGVLRGASEVLAGIPSIVLGYVGYVALVVAFGWHYSLLAGVLVLSVFVVPYVAKSTEAALRQVPTSYREGAEALGMSPTHTLRRIVLRASLPGIATGMIVALAIAIGETAPLLYTAGYSDANPSLALTHHPIGYLTYDVWTFYNLPSQASVQLSYDAALLLVALVLALIVASRLVVALTQRHAAPTRGR